MRDDLLRSNSFIIEDQSISLEALDGTTVTYEKYQTLIRRQVNGTGHEVFIRDIKTLSFEKISYGIKARITTMNGEVYEKNLNFYP